MSYMFCGCCGRKIGTKEPRVVIKQDWWCNECAYYHDRGETPPGARK